MKKHLLEALKKGREKKRVSGNTEPIPQGDDKRSFQIRRKLQESVPDRFRDVYLRATQGKSKATAMRVYCIECSGWSTSEVKRCVVLHCPMWAVRPYQPGEGEAPEANEDSA
jgi:hypothetical protein